MLPSIGNSNKSASYKGINENTDLSRTEKDTENQMLITLPPTNDDGINKIATKKYQIYII